MNTLFKYVFACILFVAFWHVIVLERDFSGFKYFGDTRFLFVFSILLLFYIRESGTISSRKSAILFSICLILLVLSLERKGIVSLVFSFSLYYILKRARLVIPMFISLISFVVVLILGNIEIIKDYFTLSEYDFLMPDMSNMWTSNGQRLLLLRSGIEHVFINPWFGTGSYTVPAINEIYYDHEIFYLYSHNFFLDLLIEYGVFGFIIFTLGLVLCVFKRFNSIYRNPFVFISLMVVIMHLTFSAPNIVLFVMLLFPFYILRYSYENITYNK
ncbi:O-antigen ligase family protein [Vibrio chagasii]|uniref:O-antigen ligase family protein n=1 Tax=Vibrio chagasii TaxID=170679 RepID=UPI003DA9E0A9